MDWSDFVALAKPEIRNCVDDMIEAAAKLGLTVMEFELAAETAKELVLTKKRLEKIDTFVPEVSV